MESVRRRDTDWKQAANSRGAAQAWLVRRFQGFDADVARLDGKGKLAARPYPRSQKHLQSRKQKNVTPLTSAAAHST